MQPGRYPPMTRRAIQRAARARGWSQNELARQIGRPPGYLSRVLRGLVISRPVWREVMRALEPQVHEHFP